MNETFFAPKSATPRKKNRGRRIILYTLGVLIFLAVLASFAVSYEVGWKLTHPERKSVNLTPSKYGLSYSTIRFPSRTDRLKLHGWLIPAAGHTDKIVITAHGYGKNRSIEKPMLPTVKALHDAGFSVLMFDFRDEGSSPGRIVTVGLYEIRDLLGAVDYVQSLGYKHIGLFGLSMGASTVLEATSKDPHVQAAIADSPFANLHNYLAKNMPVWTHLPNWPFTPEILSELRLFNGINSSKVNPLADLSHWKQRPLLLIAGTADDAVPMSNSQQLYAEVKQNPQDSLWIVKGAEHIGAYTVNPQVYEQKVTAFFKKYL